MAAPFSIEHDGRRIELIADSSWKGDRVRLRIDGEEVAEAKPDGVKTVVSGGGVVVRAQVPWHGASIKRAELVRDDGAPLPLEPAPGTRAARRARLERERPGLYAARHVAKGIGQAALALVGIAFLVRFLPAIPFPSIDLPDLPLPSIDAPDLPVPEIEVPGWIKAIAQTKQYWLPVLVGIALAVREWRRRGAKRQVRDRARAATGRQGRGSAR